MNHRLALLAAAAALCLAPSSHAADPPFVERTAEPGLRFEHFNGMSGELYFAENMGSGAALFDYDGDGDLDVYLVQGAMLGDRPLSEATFPPAPPPVPGNPLSDRLFRNDLVRAPGGRAEPRFVDVTEEAGLAGAVDYGMGAAVGDVDGDGDLDLYVTAFGANRLWRNEGDGSFTDVTAASGTEEDRWSVPAVFFDAEGDGDLDLYVGNYVDFRLALHEPCSTNAGRAIYCGPLSYEPLTDRLFLNRGDGIFSDASAASRVGTQPGSALGAIAADFDGDGRTDLYVANDQMPNFLWLAGEGGVFREEALLSGLGVNAAGDPEASMGVDLGDVDGDGDEDLFITHLTQETNTLYRADGGGLFADVTLTSGLGPPSLPETAFGTRFLDFDLDGDLDLIAVNGAVRQIEAQVEAGDPHPLRQRDQLFANRGDGTFEEVTAAAGPAFEPLLVSRGAAVGDVEGDGDPDVLVTHNAGPARLLMATAADAGAGDGAGASPGWLGVIPSTAPGAVGTEARLGTVGGEGPLLRRRSHTDGSYASASDPRVLFGLGSLLGAGERGAAGKEADLELLLRSPGGAALRIRGLPLRVWVVAPRPVLPEKGSEAGR